ncbi:RNA-binding protein 20 [Rhinophrynus dorsalis]
MLLAAMSQALDPREPEQPGGAALPQTGHNAAVFLDKNPFTVNNPLGGGATNPLLTSPASLQLAQLQAQLTLQRLKLAQTAVTNNTAAATVLNQVLSKVAMSQPLFNPLRNAAMIGAHGHTGVSPLGPAMPNARFPSTGIPFPGQNPALAQNHTQNPNSMPPFGKGMGGNKPGVFYAGSQAFNPDTEQSGYHGLMVGASGSDGHYGPKHDHSPGFKKDFYDSQGPHRPMNQKGDLGPGSHNSSSNNQWDSSRVWQSPSQHYEGRNELYNPEEPTPDTKFSPSSSPVFSRHNNGKVTNCTSSLKVLQPHELNDYHGIPPLHLPHTCTMCDKKVFNLKDWELHIKGRMHIQNVMGYTENTGIHCMSSSTDGTSLNADFNPVTSEGFVPDIDQVYVSSAPAVAYLQPGLAFPVPPSAVKYAQKKSSNGRVVHICNLPEGSCNENDVVNLGLPFGKVTNYILMKSTNQAFLEMAYTEAAEAMVQFYQEKPAMINDEKLLIRMSKRYRELQLKKPGKNVDAIIYDIHSQRERDVFRDTDRYRNERTRSRSPVSRSLSPRSHTPSFTSCSSTQSPLGASRTEWGNGREPWDQSSYGRWEDEREQGNWRDNGEDKRERTDHWVHDRKHYSRQTEKQDLEERLDGSRGHREKYGSTHSSSRYKNRDGEYYRKDIKQKSDSKRQDTPEKSKRKEESKSREVKGSHGEDTNKKETCEPKSDKEGDSTRQKDGDETKTDEPDKKQPEDTNKQNKSDKQEEKKEMDHNSGSTKKGDKLEGADTETPVKHKEDEWESDLEGETWYPTNMEELVTVDEVGEDDLIIEPDITELEEIVPVISKDSDNCIQMCSHEISTIDMECTCSHSTRSVCSSPREVSIAMSGTSVRESTSPGSSCYDPVGDVPDINLNPKQKCDDLEDNRVPRSLHEKERLAEDSESVKNPTDLRNPEDIDVSSENVHKRRDCEADSSVKLMVINTIQESRDKRDQDLSLPGHCVSAEMKSPEVPEFELKEVHSSPSWEQEDVFSELSIPLGMEFVVPRTGFYCKLCGLFYTSEETAKTSHCRSRVHYKNLQSYLSRLAEGSLGKNETENMLRQEDVGIVPQFEKNRP